VLVTVHTDSAVRRDKQIPNRYVACGLCSVCLPAGMFPCSQGDLIVLEFPGGYSFCPSSTQSIVDWLKKSRPVLLFAIFAFRSLEASQYCRRHLIGVILCEVTDLCYCPLASFGTCMKLLNVAAVLSSMLRVCCHTLALCSIVQVLSFDLSIYSLLRDSAISCCPVLNTNNYLWNKQHVAEEHLRRRRWQVTGENFLTRDMLHQCH
jgi:hypothetical protein